MNTSFTHPPAGTNDVTPEPWPGAPADPPAAGPSDRACCCPAQAMVQVVLPPTDTRPEATDLLLCGHHYRAYRRALAAAHAVVHELPGMPSDTAAWIHDDHDRSPAQAALA